MPYRLELPGHLADAGWTVKIYEAENREPPHVTIRRRGDVFRLNLRDGRLLDDRPPGRELPKELVELLLASWAELCAAWDARHPTNPVRGED